MDEQNLKVFNLTVPSKRVVEDVNVDGAAGRDISDLELLQLVELAKSGEDHLVHYTVHFLIFKLELEFSESVSF